MPQPNEPDYDILYDLVCVPMTPEEFRSKLIGDYLAWGLKYDSYLEMILRRGINAVEAEKIAYMEIRKDWYRKLTKAEKDALNNRYMRERQGKATIINLAMNYPAAGKSPEKALMDGVGPSYWVELLKKIYPEEAAEMIIRRIKELGGYGKIYEVRHREIPEKGWRISVKTITAEELYEYQKKDL